MHKADTRAGSAAKTGHRSGAAIESGISQKATFRTTPLYVLPPGHQRYRFISRDFPNMKAGFVLLHFRAGGEYWRNTIPVAL
ncbi:MAG: hypothetical protein OEN55_02985 [Alphaproteobacteria bacterium]|nr:hypothetical protein [Alphaproteobacteria bacterium]